MIDEGRSRGQSWNGNGEGWAAERVERCIVKNCPWVKFLKDPVGSCMGFCSPFFGLFDWGGGCMRASFFVSCSTACERELKERVDPVCRVESLGRERGKKGRNLLWLSYLLDFLCRLLVCPDLLCVSPGAIRSVCDAKDKKKSSVEIWMGAPRGAQHCHSFFLRRSMH